MANSDIRLAAAGVGVRLWKIAEVLGIADSSLSRKLRRELAESEKDKIYSIIEQLRAEGVSTHAS